MKVLQGSLHSNSSLCCDHLLQGELLEQACRGVELPKALVWLPMLWWWGGGGVQPCSFSPGLHPVSRELLHQWMVQLNAQVGERCFAG